LKRFDYSKKLKWSTSLSVDEQKELERLKADGHKFDSDGRHFICEILPENVRITQLYRTLLHEVGHYVHYLEFVERQGTEDEAFEVWESRNDKYFKIAQADKEVFAHKYADTLRQKLVEQQVIPFDPL
jgi:cobyrinic acid a,c-diamide synthase